SGASLQLLGTGMNLFNPLVLNGTGVNGAGALENLVGSSNTWSGNIVLASNATIGVDAGTTLTLPAAALDGMPLGGLSGPGGVTKVGSGTLVLSATSTYTGDTVVSGGILNIQTGLA